MPAENLNELVRELEQVRIARQESIYEIDAIQRRLETVSAHEARILRSIRAAHNSAVYNEGNSNNNTGGNNTLRIGNQVRITNALRDKYGIV